MTRLCVIAARGGSKRIPKKNIRPFCGKPILWYSIEAAKKSGVFDEIMVSTDSEEIADFAREQGAVVPFFRSEENAGDFATTSDVLIEVIASYEARGQRFDEICCLYPTAPFVTGEKLKDALSVLEQDAAVDTVIPVVRFSYPPQRGLLIRDSYLVMREPEHSRTRSQDLDPLYHDAGQFYWFKTERFLATKDLLSGMIAPYLMPELEVQDIDTETDWLLAEQKYLLLRSEKHETL